MIFSRILNVFEIYLKLTEWMRNYISYYIEIAESLQNRKTIFLKKKSIKNNFKKTFSKRTFINQLINAEYQLYEYLQSKFSKSNFLIYFEAMKSTFIDVDVSKEKKFEIMIFHVQNNFEENDIIIIKNEIQFIMFFSKILIDAETRYWLIELKMIEVVWIVKKICHMIESCRKSSMIIFIDHAVTADLIKQIFLTTFNTNKLNLRFVRAFQFLSTLFIKIRIKSEKFHVIFDVLFRFKTNSDSNVENLFSNRKNKKTVVLKNLNNVKKIFAHVRQLKHRSLRNVWFYHVNKVLNAHFDDEKNSVENKWRVQKNIKKNIYRRFTIKQNSIENLSLKKSKRHFERHEFRFQKELTILRFIKKNVSTLHFMKNEKKKHFSNCSWRELSLRILSRVR